MILELQNRANTSKNVQNGERRFFSDDWVFTFTRWSDLLAAKISKIRVRNVLKQIRLSKKPRWQRTCRVERTILLRSK